MLLRNCDKDLEYDVHGPVYENEVTKIWCGKCNIPNNMNAFVKILNYGEIENSRVREELLEMSKQEANTLKKISNCSRRVPAYIDAWNDNKKHQYVIVMSQVPGISLRKWMDSHKKQQIEAKDVYVRVKIIQQICEIMRDLTNRNVWLVHRDLKPENICINFNEKEKRWDVYIIDFGCANLNHVRKVGTTNYQSPEQIGLKDSGVKINASVDIFAIGQIFYELLIGNVPVIGLDYTYKAKEQEWVQTPVFPDYLLKLNGVPKIYETFKQMTAFQSENRTSFSKVITVLKNVRIG